MENVNVRLAAEEIKNLVPPVLVELEINGFKAFLMEYERYRVRGGQNAMVHCLSADVFRVLETHSVSEVRREWDAALMDRDFRFGQEIALVSVLLHAMGVTPLEVRRMVQVIDFPDPDKGRAYAMYGRIVKFFTRIENVFGYLTAEGYRDRVAVRFRQERALERVASGQTVPRYQLLSRSPASESSESSRTVSHLGTIMEEGGRSSDRGKTAETSSPAEVRRTVTVEERTESSGEEQESAEDDVIEGLTSLMAAMQQKPTVKAVADAVQQLARTMMMQKSKSESGGATGEPKEGRMLESAETKENKDRTYWRKVFNPEASINAAWVYRFVTRSIPGNAGEQFRRQLKMESARKFASYEECKQVVLSWAHRLDEVNHQQYVYGSSELRGTQQSKARDGQRRLWSKSMGSERAKSKSDHDWLKEKKRP